MLHPRPKLLLLFALLGVPLAGLGGALPPFLPHALAGLALLALLFLLDAALAGRGLENLALTTPEHLRLVKNRPGQLPIEITRATPRLPALRLRLGIPLPRTVHTPQPELSLLLPPGQARLQLHIPLTGLRRGSWPLQRCHLAAPSPLRLWEWRLILPLSSQLHVYPDLSHERRQLSALFLHRGPGGIRVQPQTGKGRDFEKLRDYLPGDSAEDIHWKATARRGKPVVKVFRTERTQEIYVVLDASRLALRHVPSLLREDNASSSLRLPPELRALAETQVTTLERGINCTLALAQVAQRQGDLFGTVVFDNRIRAFLRAGQGNTHYTALRETLHDLQPQPVSPDWQRLFTLLRTRLTRRSLLLFLTDLSDPVLAETFLRGVDMIARHHLVTVAMLRRPGVRELFTADPEDPETRLPLPSADLDDPITSDPLRPLHTALAGHLQWRALRELETSLRRRGVHFRQIDNSQMGLDLVATYLRIKQRQAL